MIFHKTALVDAYLIELTPFQDERGMFARTFCKQEFVQIGHAKEFVQLNHSRTQQKGTIRGLHFQRAPHAEIKLIRCIRGSVYDVIIDLRIHSPTFLQHIGVELSEQNMQMIYVPEGFAHGFQTLEDDTELIYHHTAYYAPHSEGGVRFNDPQFQINWPLPPSVMTEKDLNHPLITHSFEGIAIDFK
jgi:dTDP-4-dehydrorhamnose 3,5-epimerase